jgi:hypothetical protein
MPAEAHEKLGGVASEKSELSAYAESMLAEQKAAPSPDPASASPE